MSSSLNSCEKKEIKKNIKNTIINYLAGTIILAIPFACSGFAVGNIVASTEDAGMTLEKEI